MTGRARRSLARSDRRSTTPERRTDNGFTRLWLATGASNVGDGVTIAALPLLAASLTHDPRLIALVPAAARLPWLLVSLPAGVLVDRRDRRRLMLAANALRTVLLAALAVLVAGDRLTIGRLLPLVFVVGVAETVFDSAASSLLPGLVPAIELERANARLYGTEVVANSFLGPPLGALLFGLAPAVPAALDAATFAVALLLIASIRGSFDPRQLDRTASTTLRSGPRRSAHLRSGNLRADPTVGEDLQLAESRPREHVTELDRSGPPGESGSIPGDLREGLGWLLRHRRLRLLMIAMTLYNLVEAAVFAVLVLLVTYVLGVSDRGFGFIFVGGAVGGLLGTLVSSRIIRRIGSTATMAGSMAVAALTYIGIGRATNAVVVGVLLGIGWFVGTIVSVLVVSERQRSTPDRLARPDHLGVPDVQLRRDAGRRGARRADRRGVRGPQGRRARRRAAARRRGRDRRHPRPSAARAAAGRSCNLTGLDLTR